EDNSYSTADDDLFTLPEGDISIGIPHVLEISPTDAAAFGQLFADYELLPPFRQLDRNSYALTEDNSYSTADDDLFTLPEGDISIGIPHVLEISP
ncbi:DUF4132 domain-containing protein, partial [Enterobacter hormaechei]|uniref:DUF4132 domain-containing protein n=1 Tax=Enterobacter hormaechei TaxID=158836 RepID=UPI001F0A487D